MLVGQLTLPLPPYLIAKHNEESRKINLSVGDATIAHQRAMWGEYPRYDSSLFAFLTQLQEQCVHICKTTSLVFPKDTFVYYDSLVLDIEPRSKIAQPR